MNYMANTVDPHTRGYWYDPSTTTVYMYRRTTQRREVRALLNFLLITNSIWNARNLKHTDSFPQGSSSPRWLDPATASHVCLWSISLFRSFHILSNQCVAKLSVIVPRLLIFRMSTFSGEERFHQSQSIGASTSHANTCWFSIEGFRHPVIRYKEKVKIRGCCLYIIKSTRSTCTSSMIQCKVGAVWLRSTAVICQTIGYDSCLVAVRTWTLSRLILVCWGTYWWRRKNEEKVLPRKIVYSFRNRLNNFLIHVKKVPRTQMQKEDQPYSGCIRNPWRDLNPQSSP